MGKKRIFLYGSCVSRDTLEFMSFEQFELADYIARQSLISVDSDCSEFWPEGFSLKSPFQQRIVQGDWRGNAWRKIQEASPENLDALILDFTDERFGVYCFNDEQVVTRSIDMLGTPLEDVAASHDLVGFGSDRHFALWSAALKTLAGRLRDAGLFEKTVVLQVPWAETTDLGKELPGKLGMTPRSANQLYERYYDAVAAEGFHTVDLRGFPVFAEPLHQWGLAPYHYTLEVYEEISNQLRDFLGVTL